MVAIYLRTWKLCFLCVISVVLTITTLIHQHSNYAGLRLGVTRVFPNSSHIVTNMHGRRVDRAIFIDMDEPINETVVTMVLDLDKSENDVDVFETIGSDLGEVNPHPYKFIIDYPNYCLQHEELVLLIAVISAVSHFEERQAVRETWGEYGRKLGAKLLFFLGDDPDHSTRYKVRDESQTFQDIVQENFVDSYLNLSLKTISIVKWVSTRCSHARWVLKIDEDNLLNVDRVMKFVRNNTFKMSMYGMIAHNWPPNRSIYSKWYVSKAQYPRNIYPDFLAGPAYLFTGDSAGQLYNTSLYTPFFHLEDVYVTGIVAQRAGVKRFNLEGVTNSYQRITPCLFNRIVNSHHHSASDLRRTWYITQMKFFVCLKDWFSS